MNSQRHGHTFCTWNYYYEAIQVNVITSGSYTFSSNSSFHTYGYLYTDHFHPFNPSENLLSRDGVGCYNNQFKLVAPLQSNATYVLVVTTSDPSVTGEFSIIVLGMNNITFNRISKYLYFVNNQHRSGKCRNSL
jgi:hypothetical protein